MASCLDLKKEWQMSVYALLFSTFMSMVIIFTSGSVWSGPVVGASEALPLVTLVVWHCVAVLELRASSVHVCGHNRRCKR